MAEIQARSQPPIFFRQLEDGDRRCQSDLDILWRQNWWERSWCLNSNALLTFANVFVALNFVTLLDFSEQDFILETVMRSYSRRLDFLELNPYVFVFSWKLFLLFSCSGMFRNVPCSWFYRRPFPPTFILQVRWQSVSWPYLLLHLNLSWYPHSLNGLVRLIGANFRTNDFCYLVKWTI